MLQRTGLVARVVLVILLGFSVLSWGIMLAKWGLFKRAGFQSARFRKAFRKAQRLQDIAVVAEQFKPSPLVAVFEHAFEEVRKQAGQPRNMTAVQRAIQIGASEELTRLERRLKS